MFLRILKKDLKRKRTMNTILLLFITLASMFIASSANNMLSIMTALDTYFEMANVPDYWIATVDEASIQKFADFASENDYEYDSQQMLQINLNDVSIDGQVTELSQTLMLSTLNNIDNYGKVFDSADQEITQVNEGEIYVPSSILRSKAEIGSEIEITLNGITKTFILKDYTKDALWGSPMIGLTRFLISEQDFEDFITEETSFIYCGYINTTDQDYYQKFYDYDINLLFDADIDMLKMMYIMDLIIAALILVVSVCLILISMVILRFTITFTISEDFREIGVMKAIGLRESDIRGIYMIKYFVISIFGSTVGFFLSIPFGEMLIRDVSRNIILSSTNSLLPNFLCAVLTAVIVILFSHNCTGKIRKFSPIDAIRNGQSGERFSRKSFISLEQTRLSPVSFMSLNDIFSGMKKFITMIIIFTLGLLLILIPVNTINTLQSDHLITWFNMASCDHVIRADILLSPDADNQKLMEDKLETVRVFLSERDIPTQVFQEKMYRVSVTYQGNKTSSLAFQGLGDITDEQYVYTEGTAPQQIGEVAITSLVAQRIGAQIGDEIEITTGTTTKKYMVTALFQSMNNLGEGIRFYHQEDLSDMAVQGCFGIQVLYTDQPDKQTLSQRKELLKDVFSDGEIYSPGEYINIMTGDIAGQCGSVRLLIVFVVLGINILVTVLMVKSFIHKETGEIALLKALGFQNSFIVAWQSMRIGIVVFIATILAILLSTPLSQLTVGPVFQMMGAQSIEFSIKPWEVFVQYPILIFAVTVLAGMLTALQTRRITPSETSNIE